MPQNDATAGTPSDTDLKKVEAQGTPTSKPEDSERASQAQTRDTKRSSDDADWRKRQVQVALVAAFISLGSMAVSIGSCVISRLGAHAAERNADNSGRSAAAAEQNAQASARNLLISEETLRIKTQEESLLLEFRIDSIQNVVRIHNAGRPVEVSGISITYELRTWDDQPLRRPTARQEVKKTPAITGFPFSLERWKTLVVPLHAARSNSSGSVKSLYQNLSAEDRPTGRSGAKIYTKLHEQPIYFDALGDPKVARLTKRSPYSWPPAYAYTDDDELLVLKDYTAKFSTIRIRLTNGLEIIRTPDEIRPKAEAAELEDVERLMEE